MGGQILADQGADVIKVESFAGAQERGGGRAVVSSPLHSTLNRGKRSLALDLRQPRGVAAFLQLARTADVILQNFRPGVVERMGIGAAARRNSTPPATPAHGTCRIAAAPQHHTQHVRHTSEQCG